MNRTPPNYNLIRYELGDINEIHKNMLIAFYKTIVRQYVGNFATLFDWFNALDSGKLDNIGIRARMTPSFNKIKSKDEYGFYFAGTWIGVMFRVIEVGDIVHYGTWFTDIYDERDPE